MGRRNHVFLFDGHVRRGGCGVSRGGGLMGVAVQSGGRVARSMTVESWGLRHVAVESGGLGHVMLHVVHVTGVMLGHVPRVLHVGHVTGARRHVPIRVVAGRSHVVRVVVLDGVSGVTVRARMARVRVVPLGRAIGVSRSLHVTGVAGMRTLGALVRVRMRVGARVAISRVARVAGMPWVRAGVRLKRHSRVGCLMGHTRVGVGSWMTVVRAMVNSRVGAAWVRADAQTLANPQPPLPLRVVVQINQRTGIRIQPWGNLDLLQLFILTRLQQTILSSRPVEVRNQMQSKIRRRGDTEGLFHESVGLVSVSFWGGDELDRVG